MHASIPVLLSAGLLVSCASAPDRPAVSTVGCAQAAIDRQLPADLPDKQAHCLAGALIARSCSPAEARLAGFAKEVRDAFSHGDAEWADWTATLAGVRCEAAGGDMATIRTCCQNAVPGARPDGDRKP